MFSFKVKWPDDSLNSEAFKSLQIMLMLTLETCNFIKTNPIITMNHSVVQFCAGIKHLRLKHLGSHFHFTFHIHSRYKNATDSNSKTSLWCLHTQCLFCIPITLGKFSWSLLVWPVSVSHQTKPLTLSWKSGPQCSAASYLNWTPVCWLKLFKANHTVLLWYDVSQKLIL